MKELEDIVNKKELEEWPSDWANHIVNSNSLYFDEGRPLNIELLQISSIFFYTGGLDNNGQPSTQDLVKGISQKDTIIQCLYSLEPFAYLANHRIIGNKVKVLVCRVLLDQKTVEEEEDIIVVKSGQKAYTCKYLEEFYGVSGYESVSEVESIISKDYYENGRDDDDDADDDDGTKPFDGPPSGKILVMPSQSSIDS